MATKKYYDDDSRYYSTKQAIKLLDSGNAMTANGKNMDTIEKKDDGLYYYCGRFDQGPTIFTRGELEKADLFRGRKWALNLTK